MSESKSGIVDFAVIGGGPAGMLATLALARAGFSIVLLAPETAGDNRTSALMMPSIRMLDNLGLWQRLQPGAAALEVMRLVDDTGRLPHSPTLNFRARDIQDQPFGWNVPNRELIAGVTAELQSFQTVKIISSPATGFRSLPTRVNIRHAGGEFSSRFVVAADGRKSLARQAAGIDVQWWDHPQTALTAVLEHTKPHAGISTEFHRPSGPFTLVPMPGSRSSLVWVEAPHEAERILALGRQEQEDLIFRLSQGLLGRPSIASGLYGFPLSSMRVSAHAASRTFLVGETGHVFPPIGAQGLNLTMRDIAFLVDIFAGPQTLAETDIRDLESGYNAARRNDTWLRTYGVNLLNYSLLAPFLPVQMARTLGLGMLSAFRPLRERAMRMGMAPRHLPPLMK